VYPDKDNKAVKGLEHQSYWGAAEGTEIVQSGEEEVQGRPYSPQLPERRL